MNYLADIIAAAGDRFHADIQRALPQTAPLITELLRRVPKPGGLVEAALLPRSFPCFALPFWITPERARREDRAFQEDVAYSTVHGYFFVRLIDNVADDDGPAAVRKLMPAAHYFGAGFQSPYQMHFPSGHAFWDHFHAAWAEQAEASVVDAFLTDITLDDFNRVCSRKFSAGKVPVAAAAFRYGRENELENWYALIDRIGAFCQMVNDLFDWFHDNQHGIPSYVLSEYRRSRTERETLSNWFVRTGWSWGAGLLRQMIRELASETDLLESADAAEWVRERALLLERELEQGTKATETLRVFTSALAAAGEQTQVRSA